MAGKPAPAIISRIILLIALMDFVNKTGDLPAVWYNTKK